MKSSININELINKAAMEAIREYDKEKMLQQKKKVLHNTKLLLQHYNDLKSHVENAIDDAINLEMDFMDIGELEKDELYILSIKKSKTKTMIMIAHIDAALDSLKHKEIKLCAIEKYEALEMFYIGGVSYEDIVMKFNCGVNTPRRWMNQMLDELGVLIFGIDGLKNDMI